MDHTTMIDEIKFLINKYVEQQHTRVKEQTIDAEKNMEVLEQLPLVMSLRRRIRQLETELRVFKEGPNVYVKIEESLQETTKTPKTIQIRNSSSNIQELNNIVINNIEIKEDEEKSVEHIVVEIEDEEEDEEVEVVEIEDEEEEEEVEVVEIEEEEVEVVVEEEEEVEVVEIEEEEEIVVEEDDDEEEEEEIVVEEDDDEEEIVVEEEDDEEEMEVIEHTINGKLYYVTSTTNGEIYDEADEEFENPIGKMVNSKATFYKK